MTQYSSASKKLADEAVPGILSQFTQAQQLSLNDHRARPENSSKIQATSKKARAHACVGCRSRKVRCDFIAGATQCTGCQHRSIKCELIEAKPKTARAKRNSRLLQLEQRISRLQSLCIAAKLLPTERLQAEHCVNSNTASDEEPYSPCAEQIQNNIAEQSSAGSSAIDELRANFLPTPVSTSVAGDYGHVDYPALSGLDLDGMPTSSLHFEMSADINAAFMHRSCQTLAPRLPSVKWPHNTNALGAEIHLVESQLQVQTDAPGVHTIAVDHESSTGIATPMDSGFHFQTLSIIFADTTETQLLSELHKMTLPSTSVQLPPRDAIFSALTNFFRYFERIMPIYDEATTFHLVDLFYGSTSNSSADLSAYIYSVIALSYACNIDATSSDEESETAAWTFFSHAAQYIPRLMANSPGLLSVQALLGMASFLIINGATKTSLPLLTASLGACREMEYCNQQGYIGRHIQQLYKTAYVLYHRYDAMSRMDILMIWLILPSMSLRLGITTTECKAHTDTSPIGQSVNSLSKNQGFQNLVGPLLSLASVTCDAIDTLNAPADRHATTRFRGALPEDLNRQLEDWRESLPLPICSLYEPKKHSQPTDAAQISLQICYYQVLQLINRTGLPSSHQPPAHASSNSAEIESREHESQKSVAFCICVDAARETIRLVKNIKIGSEGFLRSLSYHVVRAATILFMNVMHFEPRSSCLSDFALLCSAQEFLETRTHRAAGSKSRAAASFSGFCTDLTATARNTMHKIG